MSRDFIGYGEIPPAISWPKSAKLAVNIVVNYEEGSENRIQDGCEHRETWGDVPSSVPAHIARDLANESMFEYGSRAGVWRIIRTLNKYHVPATFFVCAEALARNPHVAKSIVRNDYDICAHGRRWEEHFLLTEQQEADAVESAVSIIHSLTGRKPAGWYCRYSPSPNTRRIVRASGHFSYDSDSYNDDLPYFVGPEASPWLVVPYTLDANDSQFWRGNLMSGRDFADYLIDTFDVLRSEGEEVPRMMSVGLHCRIIGRPGRIAGLEQFLRYATGFEDVWFARRSEIAEWWRANYTPRRSQPSVEGM